MALPGLTFDPGTSEPAREEPLLVASSIRCHCYSKCYIMYRIRLIYNEILNACCEKLGSLLVMSSSLTKQPNRHHGREVHHPERH